MRFFLGLTTFLFTVALCTCAATPANAKISFGSKNKVLNDTQVTQIKGFMYDAWSTFEKASERQRSGPDFAKAITWLEKTHAQEKSYNILKIETPEVIVVRHAAAFIIEFINGKIHKDTPEHVIKSVLVRWLTIGQRIVATYKKDNKGKVVWDLYLQKEQPEKLKEKKKHEQDQK